MYKFIYEALIGNLSTNWQYLKIDISKNIGIIMIVERHWFLPMAFLV